MTTEELEQTGLNEYIAVYVPSTLSVDRIVSDQDFAERIDYTASVLSALFGGATLIKTTGYWQSNTGKIVKENITQVKAFSKHLTIEDVNKIIAHAIELKERYQQENISVEINNKLYFI